MGTGKHTQSSRRGQRTRQFLLTAFNVIALTLPLVAEEEARPLFHEQPLQLIHSEELIVKPEAPNHGDSVAVYTCPSNDHPGEAPEVHVPEPQEPDERTDRLAIASFVLGLLTWTAVIAATVVFLMTFDFFTPVAAWVSVVLNILGVVALTGAVLAVITGMKALKRLKLSGQKGKGLALAGTFLAAIYLLLVLLNLLVTLIATLLDQP
jgi:hypothetical protein